MPLPKPPSKPATVLPATAFGNVSVSEGPTTRKRRAGSRVEPLDIDLDFLTADLQGDEEPSVRAGAAVTQGAPVSKASGDTRAAGRAGSRAPAAAAAGAREPARPAARVSPLALLTGAPWVTAAPARTLGSSSPCRSAVRKSRSMSSGSTLEPARRLRVVGPSLTDTLPKAVAGRTVAGLEGGLGRGMGCGGKQQTVRGEGCRLQTRRLARAKGKSRTVHCAAS